MLAEYKHSEKLMGNIFEITVVSDDEICAQANIQQAISEIKRIEQLFTTFNEQSQTNQINAAAGIHPVKVDAEVFELLERCNRISEITDGAFDVSYGSLDKKLWNFDKNLQQLPEPSVAKQMVQLINYQNVTLDKNAGTVFLKRKGMRIGFGGIGKGYAADKAAALLKNLGVQSGLVNASGDISAWGTQADGQPWTIGISHPDRPGNAFAYLNISDRAIATSGNYEKFAIIDGKKYSHTINPKTGFPVTGIKSVTIVAPNAELADAMATPVTIMGVKAGLFLIDQIPQLGCIIIDDSNKIYSSKNINLS